MSHTRPIMGIRYSVLSKHAQQEVENGVVANVNLQFFIFSALAMSYRTALILSKPP